MSSSEEIAVDCKKVIGNMPEEEDDFELEELTEEVYLKEWILSGDAHRKVNFDAEIEEANYEMFCHEMKWIESPPREEKPKEPDAMDILFEYFEKKKKLMKDKATALASNKVLSDGTEPSPIPTSTLDALAF